MAYQQHTSKKFCQKLECDFTTICMLNALFGDPRIHLVQLHPAYVQKFGMKNIDRAVRLYKGTKYADTKQSFETQKQRKNAFCELLRFVCSRKYPVDVKISYSNEEELYRDTYSLLINGDINSAIRLLNKNEKHEISLLLSQSVSSQE